MNTQQTNTSPPPASGEQAQHKNGHYTIRRAFIRSNHKYDLYELALKHGKESGFIDYQAARGILLGHVHAADVLTECLEAE